MEYLFFSLNLILLVIIYSNVFTYPKSEIVNSCLSIKYQKRSDTAYKKSKVQ